MTTQTLEEMTGKPHISYSGFTTWLDCGEKFRLQRVKGIQGDPSFYLAGGSAVHHGTEVFDKLWTEGTSFSDAVRIGCEGFLSAFNEELEARPNAKWRAGGRKTAAMPNGEDANWWRSNGVQQVQRYADWRAKSNETFPLWRTPAGVTAIEIPVDPTFDGGNLLKGYIDRVHTMHDDLCVVDLKSGSREPASVLQLAVYAIAMEKEYGVRPRYGAYFMTRKGELTNPMDLTRYTESMIARWFRDFRRSVEANVFIPHVTSLCQSCDVRDACYVMNSGLSPDVEFDADL